MRARFHAKAELPKILLRVENVQDSVYDCTLDDFAVWEKVDLFVPFLTINTKRVAKGRAISEKASLPIMKELDLPQFEIFTLFSEFSYILFS